MANIVTNLFGELANDLSIKNLIQKFGRFSFDSSSQLRTAVSGTVAVSSGTVAISNTVGVSGTVAISTVTQANMSIGDIGKTGTAMLQSAQGFYGSVGANFIRS